MFVDVAVPLVVAARTKMLQGAISKKVKINLCFTPRHKKSNYFNVLISKWNINSLHTNACENLNTRERSNDSFLTSSLKLKCIHARMHMTHDKGLPQTFFLSINFYQIMNIFNVHTGLKKNPKENGQIDVTFGMMARVEREVLTDKMSCVKKSFHSFGYVSKHVLWHGKNRTTNRLRNSFFLILFCVESTDRCAKRIKISFSNLNSPFLWKNSFQRARRPYLNQKSNRNIKNLKLMININFIICT